MFDIGFSEIVVIALVALIVIGPERLPRVARTLGHLFGRMQRYVNDVKADISREMELDELRKLQASVQDAAHSIEQSVATGMGAAQSMMNDITAPAAGTPSPPLAETEGTAKADDAGAPRSPAVAAPAPQLELGLEATDVATRKQA